MRVKLAICAAIVLASGVPARAQMITASEPQSVIKALQEAGYQAKLEKDSAGDPIIRSASSGSNFSILFYNCTKGASCASIQFGTSYDTAAGKGPTLEKINEWNSTKRFGRAYLDSEKDPVVEMDLDLDDGGISAALFDDNLEFWTLIMTEFEKHIGW